MVKKNKLRTIREIIRIYEKKSNSKLKKWLDGSVKADLPLKETRIFLDLLNYSSCFKRI